MNLRCGKISCEICSMHISMVCFCLFSGMLFVVLLLCAYMSMCIYVCIYADLKITLKIVWTICPNKSKFAWTLTYFERSTHFIIQIIVITKLVRVWLNNDQLNNQLNNHGVNQRIVIVHALLSFIIRLTGEHLT